MGILFIDSSADKLDQFKIYVGEEDNHFVAGLNDSLMLLETVTEFDLAVVNYDLADATGKDLHENFRMLPETENVPILFYLEAPDPTKEGLIKKMDNTELMIAPSGEALAFKIGELLEQGTSGGDSPDQDSWSDEDTVVPGDNQPDMDALMAEMMAGQSTPVVDTPAEEEESAQSGIDDLFAQMNEPIHEAELSQKDLAPSLAALNLSQKFQGNLLEHPIVDLLEYAMTQEHITHIKLTNDLSEEVCEIYIQDQHIVDVQMEGFDLEDALFWVLNWENGDFELELLEQYENLQTEIPLDEIISDVVLKRQEFEELSETLPDLKTILIPPPDYNPDTTDLEQEYREMLRHFDGEKSINDVLAAYIDNNLYALALISQLYMDELLVESEAEEIIPGDDTPISSPSDDELLAQYGIDEESLAEEKEIAKTDPTIETGMVDQGNIDDLFSREEPGDDPLQNEKDDLLSIDTDVLESEDIEIAIDKEAYIGEIVNSFKYEETIEFKERNALYLGLMVALSFVTIAIGAYVVILELEPKTAIYNTFIIDKPPIKKIEVLNLGVENKVNYLKNRVNAVQELLNDQILKRHRKISYKKQIRSKRYGVKLREANYLIKKGNYKRAILIYRSLLKSMPDNGELLLYLAAAYYSDENNEEALKVVEKLDMLQFKSGDFLLLKAQIYEAENDFVNAIKYYQEYLKANPNSPVNREINTIVRTLAKSAKIPLVENN